MLFFQAAGAHRYALYLDGVYAGGVAVYPDGDAFSVGLLIVPSLRGRGLGPLALGLTVRRYFTAGFSLCRDFVAPDNGPSIRMHEKAGFVPAGEAQAQGRRALVYELRA